MILFLKLTSGLCKLVDPSPSNQSYIPLITHIFHTDFWPQTLILDSLSSPANWWGTSLHLFNLPASSSRVRSRWQLSLINKWAWERGTLIPGPMMRQLSHSKQDSAITCLSSKKSICLRKKDWKWNEDFVERQRWRRKRAQNSQFQKLQLILSV